MIETLVALLFAHAMADFVLQPDWMAKDKTKPKAILLHTLIVLITAQAALGQWTWPVLVLAAIHGTTDWIKARFAPANFAAFMADQCIHVLTLIAFAMWQHSLWSTGLWAQVVPSQHTDLMLYSMLILCGGILTISAGGFAIGLLMRRFSYRLPNIGLTRGGQLIGQLERGLIFFFVIVNQPAGIGFLIGAKSVMRFGTTTKDQRASEYVIIGTLASFGWALAVSYLIVFVGNLLPPLEVMPTSN